MPKEPRSFGSRELFLGLHNWLDCSILFMALYFKSPLKLHLLKV